MKPLKTTLALFSFVAILSLIICSLPDPSAAFQGDICADDECLNQPSFLGTVDPSSDPTLMRWDFEVAGPPQGPPISQTSLEFDQVVAYNALENNAGLVLEDFQLPGTGSDFSLSCWAKPTTTSTSNGTILHIGDPITPVSSNRFLISHNSSNGSIRIDIESINVPFGIKRYATPTAATPTAFAPDWFMTTVTYDGLDNAASLKIYIDGQNQIVSKSADTSISTMDNRTMVGAIGGFKVLNTAPAKHLIFMCATWDSELAPIEVVEIHSGGDGQFDLRVNSGDYVSAGSLQNYWLPGRELDPNLGRNLGPTGIDLSVATNIDPVDPDLKVFFDVPSSASTDPLACAFACRGHYRSDAFVPMSFMPTRWDPDDPDSDAICLDVPATGPAECPLCDRALTCEFFDNTPAEMDGLALDPFGDWELELEHVVVLGVPDFTGPVMVLDVCELMVWNGVDCQSVVDTFDGPETVTTAMVVPEPGIFVGLAFGLVFLGIFAHGLRHGRRQ